MIHRGKAQEILDKWKNWTAFYKDLIREDRARKDYKYYKSTQQPDRKFNTKFRQLSYNFGKMRSRRNGKSLDSIKKKALSSESSPDIQNYFSQN
ncbi:7243_t:CDS:2 [Funneliformis geosporum]|nr:7243_t:CDS:2 [Funneliformis geosporum]